MNRVNYLRIILFLGPFFLYESLLVSTGLFLLAFGIIKHEGIQKLINRLDIREFIFFTYMFHMLIGEREFAYVGVSPLFITEITIFILSVLYIQKLIKVKKLLLPYYLLVIIGLLFAIIYFPVNQISAIRDSFMLIYAIWVPIIYAVFNDKSKYTLFFELLKVFVVVKAAHYLYWVVLILLGLWFPTFEGFRFGVGFTLPSLLVLSLVIPLKEIDVKYKFLAFIMVFAVFTLFHRSIFLGIMIVYVAYLGLGTWKTQKGVLKYGSAALICLITFIFIYQYYTDFDMFTYLDRKTSTSEGNVSYRFIAWGILWEKFTDNFILGFGVGQPAFYEFGNKVFDPGNLSYFQIAEMGGNAQPHNSYLNILTRFGIFVFPIFLWGLIKPLLKVIDFFPIKKFSIPVYNRYLLLFGFLGVLYVFTFFNVALEGPHHSFPFWLTIAMVLGYDKHALQYPKVELRKTSNCNKK